MMKPKKIGAQRMQVISDTVIIQEDQSTGAAVMVHVPTKVVIKKWAAVVNMEEAAWQCMVDYAKKVVKFTGVDWDTDDPAFLFPAGGDFVQGYLDPIGFGDKDAETVSAELMEKIMRRFNKK